MTDWAKYAPRCDTCGRFVSEQGAGVSWSQTWSYASDGVPDLNDPGYRCASCTAATGPRGTNCHHPERYSGVNTVATQDPAA